ncbi:MAG TPA: hypothetical protein VEY91_00185, partial [Candidatus Limnocylindria bacterium]|nr:hypothetical protein [Candidatus Limnocylindria bacterium]
MGSVLEWLALGSALLMLGTLVLRQLWPTDLGWQIAAGRVVLAGGPPRTDSLSFLAHGREWIE